MYPGRAVLRQRPTRYVWMNCPRSRESPNRHPGAGCNCGVGAGPPATSSVQGLLDGLSIVSLQLLRAVFFVLVLFAVPRWRIVRFSSGDTSRFCPLSKRRSGGSWLGAGVNIATHSGGGLDLYEPTLKERGGAQTGVTRQPEFYHLRDGVITKVTLADELSFLAARYSSMMRSSDRIRPDCGLGFQFGHKCPDWLVFDLVFSSGARAVVSCN